MAARRSSKQQDEVGMGTLIILCLLGVILIGVFVFFLSNQPPRVYTPPVLHSAATSIPAIDVSKSYACPDTCTRARALGLTASQAADCGLDRDGDGLACYGT